MAEAFNPWAGEDGLNPESDWTIKEAKIESDERFGGNLVVKFIVDVAVEDVVVSRDKEQILSIGEGWTANGTVLTRADGSKRGFNKQTSYWQFLNGAASVLGESIRDKDPMDVSIWVGQSFHMKRTIVGKKRDGVSDRSVDIPVGKASGTSTGSTSSPSTSLDSKTLSKLEELAKTNDDHDAFMMAALELDDVRGNAEAEKIVGNSGADGLWAQTRATV